MVIADCPSVATLVKRQIPQRMRPIVGLDLGATKVAAGVVVKGEIIGRAELPTGEYASAELIIGSIRQTILDALGSAGLGLFEVEAIGLVAPGPYNKKEQSFHLMNLQAVNQIDFCNTIAQQFPGMRIFYENDANGAALAEHLFLQGEGKSYADMIYITVSSGIGGGIIIDGKLFTGPDGTAGEIGHQIISWKGETNGRCNCGNVCLEFIASGNSLVRRANEEIRSQTRMGCDLLAMLRTMHEEVPIKDAGVLALAALANDPLALELFSDLKFALSFGIINLAQILNTKLIVLGGGVMRSEALFFEDLRLLVSQQIKTVHCPFIVPAHYMDDSGIHGAAAVALRGLQGDL